MKPSSLAQEPDSTSHRSAVVFIPGVPGSPCNPAHRNAMISRSDREISSRVNDRQIAARRTESVSSGVGMGAARRIRPDRCDRIGCAVGTRNRQIRPQSVGDALFRRAAPRRSSRSIAPRCKIAVPGSSCEGWGAIQPRRTPGRALQAGAALVPKHMASTRRTSRTSVEKTYLLSPYRALWRVRDLTHYGYLLWKSGDPNSIPGKSGPGFR